MWDSSGETIFGGCSTVTAAEQPSGVEPQRTLLLAAATRRIISSSQHTVRGPVRETASEGSPAVAAAQQPSGLGASAGASFCCSRWFSVWRTRQRWWGRCSFWQQLMGILSKGECPGWSNSKPFQSKLAQSLVTNKLYKLIARAFMSAIIVYAQPRTHARPLMRV